MRSRYTCALLALSWMSACTPSSTSQDGADKKDDAGPSLRELVVPATARGPVAISLRWAGDPALEPWLEYDAGQGFARATLFAVASQVEHLEQGGRARLIWDSFADVDSDAQITLRPRWSLGGTDGEFAPRPTLELHNDPDDERLVLATHPSEMLPGGGSGSVNTRVSVLSLSADGDLIDSGQDLEVGVGPRKVVFAAHGRQAYVLNDSDGSLSVIDIDSGTASVRPQRFDLAPAFIYDLVASDDGERLFVVASDGPDSALYELDTSAGDIVAVASLSLASVSQCLALSAGGEWIALARAASGGRWLEIYDRQTLSLRASLHLEGMLCSSLRVDPRGRYLALTDELGSQQLTLVALGDLSSLRVAATISDLPAVVEVAIHPSGDALLLSTLNGNSVQSYRVAEPLALQATSTVSGGLPLAAEMHMLRRGQRRGLVLVAALSSIGLLRVGDDAQASLAGSTDTGEGIEHAVAGLAVAP